MSVVTTLDISGLTPEEYRAVLDKMGVETRPDPQIYLHVTHAIDGGFRIIEIWDTKAGFDSFLERRLGPATKELAIERQTAITVVPLHNLFAPRLGELTGLIASLPGAPGARAR
jgi:hypothetical protein